MQPHYSQSSRENATPSSGTSPVASYKEVPPPRDFIIVYKGVLSVFTQEFSLVMWLSHVRPGNEPKKYWSVPIFWGLSDRAKKIRSVFYIVNVVYNTWVRRKAI